MTDEQIRDIASELAYLVMDTEFGLLEPEYLTDSFEEKIKQLLK